MRALLRRASRSAVVVALLLATLSASLLLRAWLAPPKGTVFVGTFAYTDDYYNYLSMAEQAQRGVLLFQSKMASPALPPALLNAEWLSVGWLAAALGGQPLLAYRLFGLLVLAGMVFVADFWLVRCGLAEDRRTPALLLVMTGGGLGGLGYALGLIPGKEAFDLRTGAYPFVELLGNPHFGAGTTLLAAALAAFAAGRRRLGAVLGALLGFVRPYDAALLGAVETMAVIVSHPPRDWLRRGLPLLALLPALAHNWWVFRFSPGFRVWVSPQYAETVLSARDWLLLLGPAALAALLGFVRAEGRGAPAFAFVLRLRLWLGIALSIALLRPVSFSLQFVVGIGFPLLLLAALFLTRWRRALEICLPALAAGSVVYTWLATIPNQDTYAPVERFTIARALRPLCQPGELVFAPPDIGLFVGGLTPCWPFVSHGAAPDFPTRLDSVDRFYDPATSPEERAQLLDRHCIRHVIVPLGVGDGWLGEPTAFRTSLVARGLRGALAVESRSGPASCTVLPGAR